VLIVLIATFLLIDVGAGYYIGWYTTDTKDVQSFPLDGEVIDIARDGVFGVYVLTEGGAQNVLTGSMFPMEGARSMAVGDESGAIAVADGDGKVILFPNTSGVWAFNTTLDGDVTLLGIGERFQTPMSLPEHVLLLLDNGTGTHLVALSIQSGGTIDWSLPLTSEVVDIETSRSCRYFVLGFENDTAIKFSRLDPRPREIVQLPGDLEEVCIGRDGLILATLFDDSMLWINSSIGSEEIDLGAQASDLMMRENGEFIYLRTEDSVLEIEGGGVRERVTNSDLVSYTVPTVSDRLFVLTEGEMIAYHGTRAGAVWKADVDVEDLISDPTGETIWGVSDDQLVLVDNSAAAQGSKDAWFVFGLALIAQGAVLIALIMKDKVLKAQKDTLYVMMIGTFVGLAVAALSPWENVIEWFGSDTAYYLIATSICSIAVIVAWDSLSGLASPFLGAVTGFISAIPVGLMAAFFLWATGYVFPEDELLFNSILNAVPLGGFMGFVGGLFAYIAQRFLRL